MSIGKMPGAGEPLTGEALNRWRAFWEAAGGVPEWFGRLPWLAGEVPASKIK